MQRFKIFIVIIFFTLLLPNISAQEDQTNNENWFKSRFDQRIYLGFYDSFGDEKANILQAGYDAALKLIYITPAWYLMDCSLGMDILMVRDQIEKESSDMIGHVRHTDNRLIPGFEFNWGVRLYFPPIPKIKTSFYFEGQLITLVIYTKPYPDTGTYVNIGTHVGFGFKFFINDFLNGYTTIKLFSHTSNGQPEETNPALDFVGIIFGLQF
jgi:hypothetical protein